MWIWLLVALVALVAVAACVKAYIPGFAKNNRLFPDVLSQSNVQACLERLSHPASSAGPGLLTPVDKARLDAVQVLNGGAIVYEHTHRATATILAQFPGGGSGAGSGFVVRVEPNGAATFLTGAHVVLSGAGTTPGAVPANAIYAATPQGLVQCDLVATDVAADMALLRSREKPFTELNTPPLAFLADGTAPTGSDVWAIGDPLGIDISSISGGTVRDGKYVPGTYAGSIESVYTSAPVLPGNSGGCFLDTAGRVIGLANWVGKYKGAHQSNYSGGVNSYMASRIVQRLLAGTHTKGFAGVLKFDILAGADALALRDHYPTTFDASLAGGVILKSILAGGPAAKAGLRSEDILVEVGGVSVGPYAGQYSPTRITWFHSLSTPLTVKFVRPSSASQVPVTAQLTLVPYPPQYDVVFSTAF